MDICVFISSSNDILDRHNYIHFTSNAEMSHPKQFHVSRPKRNGFLNNDAHATFLNLVYIMLLGVLLSNLMMQVIRQYPY